MTPSGAKISRAAVPDGAGEAQPGPRFCSPAYGAAKAGGLSLMRHIATEFGPHGITANTVVLGLISEEDNEMFRRLAAHLPVRRRGTPEDLGALCVFVASREAGWPTGQSIHLNGGQYGA